MMQFSTSLMEDESFRWARALSRALGGLETVNSVFSF
jgi:hypothetical protein